MLITEVQECIQTHNMFLPGARVIVAVSGGADSTALLAVLVHLQSYYQLSLHVAHVNHQLRGSEAERDALFVAKQARRFKLSFHQQRIHLDALRQHKHLSLQHAARQLRYRFLDSLRLALDATHIALGHTFDDQAETFMMRLLRGSSPHGMTGIPAVRSAVVRPLLRSRRSTILAYLRAARLPWIEDSSNSHTLYTRNQIRLHLFPTLLSYSRRLPERLDDLITMLQAETSELCHLTDFWRTQIVAGQPGDHVRLKKSSFLAAPLAVQRRLLHELLSQWGAEPQTVPFRHVEGLRRFITTAPPPQRYALPGNLLAEHQRDDNVWLGKLSARRTYAMPLAVPGKLLLPFLQVCVIAQTLSQLPSGSPDPYQVFLDLDCLSFPLTVRFWQPGDRFHPLGSAGSQKLQDFFVNHKILRSQRLEIPLVADQRGIVWVVGYQIAHTSKVTRATQHILQLQCVKLRL